MHSGTTFWAIQVNTFKLQQSLPKDQFHPKRRELQSNLKAALNNVTDYKTEQLAIVAFNKLPNDLQVVSHIVETTPIFGIL
jgi:hypothetical protein